jgi:hypothetical protein
VPEQPELAIDTAQCSVEEAVQMVVLRLEHEGFCAEEREMHIQQLMDTSGVKFGTSGARGLAADMTAPVCYAYAAAFLQVIGARPGGAVAWAWTCAQQPRHRRRLCRRDPRHRPGTRLLRRAAHSGPGLLRPGARHARHHGHRQPHPL